MGLLSPSHALAATVLEDFHIGNDTFVDTRTLTMSSRLILSPSRVADEIREFVVDNDAFKSATMPSLRDSIKLQVFSLGKNNFQPSKTGIEFDGGRARAT